MEKCLVEMIDTCIVCGNVCANEDLNWITDQDTADQYDAEINDLICDDCV